MRFRATVSSLVGLLVMGLAVPAMAVGGGKPLEHERFDERFVEEPDAQVLDLCGVEVRTEFHYWGSFTLYSDMSARTHQNTEIVATDPSTGEVLLVERNASQVSSEPVVEIVDEGAGTLTATFEATFRGVPFKWRIPGEGVIILDAGTVTMTFTVVTDLETGEEISFEVAYSDVHGPHPSHSQSEIEWTEMFCGAMGA